MYILYTMYMSEYTVKEFRDNVRKALNEVDEGGRVTIRRYEKTYRLLSSDLKIVKKSGIGVVSLDKPIIKTPADAKEVLGKISKPNTRKVKLCKHGNEVGFCFDKRVDRSCKL